MNLTPLDIRKQEFGKKTRGYDSEEVDSFLEMVADEFERLLAKSRELSGQLDAYKKESDKYKQSESAIHDSLKDIQKAQEEKSEKIKNEAEFIIQKAELKADQIVHVARKKYSRIMDELHVLEGQRKGFLLKMHHVLKSQLELIKILEQDSPLKSSRKKSTKKPKP